MNRWRSRTRSSASRPSRSTKTQRARRRTRPTTGATREPVAPAVGAARRRAAARRRRAAAARRAARRRSARRRRARWPRLDAACGLGAPSAGARVGRGAERSGSVTGRRLSVLQQVASSTEADRRVRKIDMMIASPTTTSAAATTITKNAITWPVEVAVDAGERDEREVRGVEHQLDAHEHDDRVAPHQDGGARRSRTGAPKGTASGRGSRAAPFPSGPVVPSRAGSVAASGPRARRRGALARRPSGPGRRSGSVELGLDDGDVVRELRQVAHLAADA